MPFNIGQMLFLCTVLRKGAATYLPILNISTELESVVQIIGNYHRLR